MKKEIKSWQGTKKRQDNNKKEFIYKQDLDKKQDRNKKQEINKKQDNYIRQDINIKQENGKKRDFNKKQDTNKKQYIKFDSDKKQDIKQDKKIKLDSEKKSTWNKNQNIKYNTKKNQDMTNHQDMKKVHDFQYDKKLKQEFNKKSDIDINHTEMKQQDSYKQQNSYKRQEFTKKKSKGEYCPVIQKCGGCHVLSKDYTTHLQDKEKQVGKLIGNYCKIEPIVGMKDPFHYRNKVHAVFDHDKKGNPISGVYEEGTHNVVPLDSCLIHDKKADEIINSIRGLLKSFKIKTYDEDTQYGLLRHVLIRTGHISGEIMVVLVIASPIFPSKNNFVKAIRKLHPEISTIVLNINDKRTNMILGEKEHVLYGKGYIEDTLCGKVFRISPKSFYQVNSIQTEVLYSKAIELAGLSGKETLIDAYCGIGTIGLIASDKANKVIGVELNKDAIRDAITNAKRNQISNVEFYNADASEFMSQLAEQKMSADVVFMDPPRAGSDEKFLNSLVTLGPEKVVYISCNPETLERDMRYLEKKGYKTKRVIPVDMFPWTRHVETCCLLYKAK